MQLQEVLQGVHVSGGFDPLLDITDIAYDSRKACAGTMFVCLSGARTDGHFFAKNAYDTGCRIFLCEKPIDVPDDAVILSCADTRAALAVCACNFFRHPYRDIKVIGITGTKGKTTTAHIIKAVLEHAGIPTGIIGTVGAAFCDKVLPTVNTTPESYELQKLLRMMADAGCRAAAIEVSSLGLKFHRVDGLQFDTAVFTNLSPDHIGTNEHDSFEEYAGWKKQLFAHCDYAVLNGDDPFSETIAQFCPCPKVTYGFSRNADVRLLNAARSKRDHQLGVACSAVLCGEDFSFFLSLPGTVNAYNALAAAAVAKRFGVANETICEALANVHVKGRGEVVDTHTPYSVIIDYAHNGVSLKSIIETARAYDHNRIIALYGSVGSRTEIRRKELGLVSGALCDLSILTSDDPEFEDPDQIIAEIARYVEEAGGKHVDIPDRAEAIRYALSIAEPGDILIFAGKGHEEFMKVRGEKLPFSEKKVIFEYLNMKGQATSDQGLGLRN